MTTTRPAEIKFATDKRGRKIAWKWSRPAMRWIKVSVFEAEVRIAMGEWTEAKGLGR